MECQIRDLLGPVFIWARRKIYFSKTYMANHKILFVGHVQVYLLGENLFAKIPLFDLGFSCRCFCVSINNSSPPCRRNRWIMEVDRNDLLATWFYVETRGLNVEVHDIVERYDRYDVLGAERMEGWKVLLDSSVKFFPLLSVFVFGIFVRIPAKHSIKVFAGRLISLWNASLLKFYFTDLYIEEQGVIRR